MAPRSRQYTDRNGISRMNPMELVSARLKDAALALDEHRRANLRLEFSESRYDEDVSAYHGLLRFRAVIEENS